MDDGAVPNMVLSALDDHGELEGVGRASQGMHDEGGLKSRG